MKKAGISLISLVITIIVIIILAAIVIFNGLNAPDSAKFAKYSQQVDSFQSAVHDEYLKRVAQYAVESQTRTDKEIYYMIATGKESDITERIKTEEQAETGRLDELGLTIQPTELEGEEYYEVNFDANIGDVKDTKGLYSAFKEEEKHYITDKGEFFVLPGYQYKNNETSKWYITAGKYYEGEEPKIP